MGDAGWPWSAPSDHDYLDATGNGDLVAAEPERVRRYRPEQVGGYRVTDCSQVPCRHARDEGRGR